MSVSDFHARKVDHKEQSIHEQIEIEASRSRQLKGQHFTQDDRTSKMNTIENQFDENIQRLQQEAHKAGLDVTQTHSEFGPSYLMQNTASDRFTSLKKKAAP